MKLLLLCDLNVTYLLTANQLPSLRKIVSFNVNLNVKIYKKK